jgi:HlyD family secretion protein
MKRWIIIVLVIALAVVGLVSWLKRPTNNRKVYRTVKVEQGDLVQTIKATGTVQPIKLVQVGSQVTGQIKKLFVDYNSVVTQGQIIAQIDDTTFKAKVEQDQANLNKALADVEQGRAKLKLARKEAERDRELASHDIVSKSALDTSITNRDATAAGLKTLAAVVAQARAVLEMDKINLGYTTIRSPVNGVVVARNVDEGQTVIASLSVQTIFNIATDLHQVQVQGSIPEADIGKIQPGDPVRFTVDAFPDDDFAGKVSEVRLAATTLQNVVTYPVIVLADNADGKLKPSMTANIFIEVERRAQALMVPNAALRFQPSAADKGPAPAVDDGGTAEGKPGKKPQRELWIKTSTGIAPVKVTAGISDGTYTEIVAGDIKSGQDVVVGVEEQGKKGEAPSNPFMPKFNKSSKRGMRM